MQAHEGYAGSQCTGVKLISRTGAEEIDPAQLQSGVFKEETTKKKGGLGSDSCHKEGGGQAAIYSSAEGYRLSEANIVKL